MSESKTDKFLTKIRDVIAEHQLTVTIDSHKLRTVRDRSTVVMQVFIESRKGEACGYSTEYSLRLLQIVRGLHDEGVVTYRKEPNAKTYDRYLVLVPRAPMSAPQYGLFDYPVEQYQNNVNYFLYQAIMPKFLPDLKWVIYGLISNASAIEGTLGFEQWYEKHIPDGNKNQQTQRHWIERYEKDKNEAHQLQKLLGIDAYEMLVQAMLDGTLED